MDLFEDSGFSRGKRPLLMAVSLVAIVALGLSGLYQGFRLTWRDYGPAPSYPQIASEPLPAPPPADPTPQQATADAPEVSAPSRLDLAAADPALGAVPIQPPSVLPQPTDGSPQSPAATAPSDPANRDALVQPTAFHPQQPMPDQAPQVSDPGAAAPADPGDAPIQPPR
jgi:hypothetical protein